MSEKRYFKIFSSKHVIGGKNDYVLLFDTLDKQDEYDEEFLKKQTFVKNLSAEKNYLYKLVLKALNAYHLDLNTKTKIYTNLQSIEILYHKGLYSQAEKLTNKTLKLAVESELFTHALSVLEILVELVSKQFKYSDVIEKIEYAESLTELLTNFQDLQKHTMKAYQSQWELGYSRSKEDQIGFESFINHPLNAEGYATSERAKMYQLGLNLTHAFFVNHQEEMIELSLEMVKLYESKTFLIEFSTIGYIASLYNTSSAYLKKANYNKALDFVDKLDDIKDKYGIPTSLNLGSRVFFYSTNSRLDIYLKQDEYDACEGVVLESLKELKKFKRYIGASHLFEYYFLVAKYFFIKEDYRKSLKYTNLILNETKHKQRKDLKSVVRLLNLLIHYELGNDFSLEYLTKNTYNYFKSKNRLFKVEKELIRFISGRNKDVANEVLNDDLLQLKEAMKDHKNDPNEKIPFSYFDFEYWADAKLNNKRIQDIK